MSSNIPYCFENEWVRLPLDKLVPAKVISKATRQTKKYLQIAGSISEVGLVEPLVVFKIRGGGGTYMILDGHIRHEVLKERGETAVQCLIAKDDETYTYNKRVNRLSSVQEHLMIVRAINNGVSPERVSKALGMNIESVRRKASLLNNICPEAVAILKDARFTHETAAVLRKMKPVRQIEVAELMVATGNFASSYARALLMATNANQLVSPNRRRLTPGISAEEREKMEREMEGLQRDIKAVEDQYATNMLRLVVANGYIGRLMENASVARYLETHHTDICEQLISVQDSIDNDLGTSAR